MNVRPQLSRRQVGKSLLAAGVAVPFTGLSHGAATAADSSREPMNRFPRMMQEHLVHQVRVAHKMSVDAKAALKTREDAEDYVAKVREKIAFSFGPIPERTALKARTTGIVDRDAYTIEKIIFESRPNFPVTANLYLPKVTGRVPGVVGTCGHSSNGKAAEAYQSFSQGLARLGYACLIYDPIGQGERLQYHTEEGKSKYGVGVREHIHAGNQQFLVGENLSMWRAWDGIRALDYLLTRSEVDPEHIGVTGNSGGGTMTTWLCGVERRWTMAAPACFVTTFLRNAENELPADTEQCPPRALALGLEHEDFLIAMAPKPIVILAKERDFFDVRGSEEAYLRIRKVYELLGAAENISLHVGPTEHGYSIENREAMYRWFNQVTGASSSQVEPEITLEEDATLQCTESGQVSELNPATVFSFTSDKALRLEKRRPAIGKKQLIRAIKDVLKLPKLPSENPEYRILRSIGNRGYPQAAATAYAVETQKQVFAICYLLANSQHRARPGHGTGRATLYVPHRSSDAELRDEKWLRDRIGGAGNPVFSCDVRGIGESLPNTCGINTFDNPYGCDYFYSVHGLMLDRPYLGQKVYDVLRTVQWIQSFGYQEIDLIGNGWGAIIGTLAACVTPSIVAIHSHNRIESFASIAQSEDYDLPLAYLPLNLLAEFDLGDCDRILSAREVSVN